MKDMVRSFIVSLAILIASVVIGTSMIRAAQIIADSLKVKEADSSARIVSELARILRDKEPSGSREAAEYRKILDSIGSKRVKGVSVGTNPLKGASGAPVVMVEFSDFQCPFSKKFYQQTFPQIEKEYIATGKVKFFFRDLPLEMHQDAKLAAIAARCAGQQGKYWKMFDKLLKGDSFDQGAVKRYAQELGLDMKAFEKGMKNLTIQQAVETDLKEAREFGAQGTPTFFINGRFVNGAVPFDVFKRIIDEELAQQAKEK
ncbi:MAG: DsbA family protein [Candidatus Omnitrophica bacterium]|nr:DsbA family protein [Candidatus Omnitrophota bacterium]